MHSPGKSLRCRHDAELDGLREAVSARDARLADRTAAISFVLNWAATPDPPVTSDVYPRVTGESYVAGGHRLAFAARDGAQRLSADELADTRARLERAREG